MPEHDAAVERVAVDRVLVGVGVPQIELRQRRSVRSSATKVTTAPGSSVMRKTSASWLSWRSGREALARRDVGDARGAEVGPEEAGADEPEMRRDEQAVDLLVAVVGEREDDPVRAADAFLRAHLDAAHDAVGARRGRNLDAVVRLVEELDRAGEVERPPVERHRDRFERARRRPWR